MTLFCNSCHKEIKVPEVAKYNGWQGHYSLLPDSEKKSNPEVYCPECHRNVTK